MAINDKNNVATNPMAAALAKSGLTQESATAATKASAPAQNAHAETRTNYGNHQDVFQDVANGISGRVVATGPMGQITGYSPVDQASIFGEGLTLVNGGLSQLVTLTKTIMEKNPMVTQYRDVVAIPLDQNNNGVGYDILVIATKQKNLPDAQWGAYALILCRAEDTMDRESVNDTTTGRTFEADVYPSQLGTMEGMANYIETEVAKYIGDKAHVHYAGAAALFTDLVDTKSEDGFVPAFLNAVNAGQTRAFANLAYSKGTIRDINLAGMDFNGQMELERRLTNGVAYDFHANPVRADWEHILYLRSNKTGDNRQKQFGRQSQELMTINGYTDIAMTPAATTGGVNSRRQYRRRAQGESTQVFSPIHVFTNIAPRVKQSLGNMLHAMAIGMGAFNDADENWCESFVLNPSERPANWPHRIAGLGYSVSKYFNLPVFSEFPAPDTDPEYSDNKYWETLDNYFKENYSFALEVGLGTPTQWMYQDFIRAAFEPEDRIGQKGSANRFILETADMLTNGNFSRIYQELGGSGRMFRTPENRRYLVGRYQNSQTNELRSLQDIDRAFLCNAVNDNPSNLAYVSELITAQNAANIDVPQVVDMQMGLVRTFMPHASVYGYGVRLEADWVFSAALYRSVLLVSPAISSRSLNAQYGYSDFNNSDIGKAMVDNLGSSMLVNYTPGQNRRGNSFSAVGNYY